MSDDNYLIRNMTEAEVSFAVGLAAEEGWNPGIYDAECFYAADPHGFLIGLLDGEPISTISVVRYGDTYGFLGFYIVKPEYRGRRYGLRIWQAGMKHLDYVDVGLDGVVQQVENYQKSGFKLAYYNSRYVGRAGSFRKDHKHRIVELSDIPVDHLTEYDASIFPAPRPKFLKRWISQPQGVALGIMKEDQLAGYAVLRKCISGSKIGPLFADDESLAEELFQELNTRVPEGTEIFLDVPGEQENPAAARLARRHGMEIVFKTARMYRMWNPGELNIPLNRCFGVTTFELG